MLLKETEGMRTQLLFLWTSELNWAGPGFQIPVLVMFSYSSGPLDVTEVTKETFPNYPQDKNLWFSKGQVNFLNRHLSHSPSTGVGGWGGEMPWLLHQRGALQQRLTPGILGVLCLSRYFLHAQDHVEEPVSSYQLWQIAAYKLGSFFRPRYFIHIALKDLYHFYIDVVREFQLGRYR